MNDGNNALSYPGKRKRNIAALFSDLRLMTAKK